MNKKKYPVLEKVINSLINNRKPFALLVLVILIMMLFISKVPVIDSTLSGYNVDNNPYDSVGQRISSLFGTKNMIQVLIKPKPESARDLHTGLTEVEKEIKTAFPGTRVESINNTSILQRETFINDMPVREILEKAIGIPIIVNLVSRDTCNLLMVVFADSAKNIDIKSFDLIIGDKYLGIESMYAISQDHIQKEIEKSIIRDYLVILPVILLFIIGFLYLSYRNLSAILFCVINLCLSFVPVVFFLSLFRVNINQVISSALPVVVILSLSNSVHLITGFINHQSEVDLNLRVFQTFRHYFIPSFLSSFTTAIAFGSFFLSDSHYVRQFGLVTSCSILTVFVLTYMIAPLTIRFIHKGKTNFTKPRLLVTLEKWLLNNNKEISLAFMIVVVVSLFFISGIKFGTNLETFIPRNTDARTNTMLMKKAFHSIAEIDMLIETNTLDTTSSKVNLRGRLISAVSELSEKIALYPETASVQSIKNQMDYERQNKLFGISTVRFPRLGNPFVSTDRAEYRINIKIRNQEDIASLTRKIENDFKKYEPDLCYSIYSDFLYFDYISSSVTKSLLRSLLFSALIIFLIIFLFSRSIRATVISFLANLVPLSFLVIIFAVFRINVNITTSITLVICLGLIVDDSIHILYRRTRLLEPLGELGFGVLVTSLILTGGFLTFVLSQSHPNQVFGLLCSIVFLVAAISDMTIISWLLNVKAGQSDHI